MNDLAVQTVNGEDAWSSARCTLNHDGCVVCSDAGIPVTVLELHGDDALCCDSSGNQESIAIELVAPVTRGDILIVHGGVAIGRLGAAAVATAGEEKRT